MPNNTAIATADLTTADPKLIDARLAEIYNETHRIEGRIESALRGIHSAAGDRRSLYNKTKPYLLSDEDAIAKVMEKAFVWEVTTVHEYHELEATLAEMRAESMQLDAEFSRRKGWSRFFIVQNHGGHIHRTMNCSTCRMTTRFGWLPDLSGETEADAVAAHGALLCTVCYPSAPVEWTNARELAAAAKAADRCPGSGTYLNRELKHRTGFAHGNWGTCPECGDHVTVTSAFKLRAHKASK